MEIFLISTSIHLFSQRLFLFRVTACLVHYFSKSEKYQEHSFHENEELLLRAGISVNIFLPLFQEAIVPLLYGYDSKDVEKLCNPSQKK